MKTILVRAMVSLAAAVLLGGTAVADQPSMPSVAAAYNRFGFHLAHELQSESASKNVIISPASVAIALAMTSDGAVENTRAAMRRVLDVAEMPDKAFDAGNAGLLGELRSASGDVKFSIANALWLNQNVPPLASFVGTMRDTFGTTAENVPFGDPAAAERINDWVKKNTDGLIPSILDSTSHDDAMVLTNALALEAKWEIPFEKHATHDAPFTLAGGSTSTVSMMERQGSYAYAENASWQIAKLPYRGDRFAMYVLLPKAGVKLADAFGSLDAAAFDEAAKSASSQTVNFAMPRFTAEYKTSLVQPLSKLGMAVAFSRDADFTKMVAPPTKIAISDVQHRTFVQVDEDGTKAAAATSVTMTTLAIMHPDHVVQMIVDHPFAFVIRDENSGQILFLGTVYDPKS